MPDLIGEFRLKESQTSHVILPMRQVIFHVVVCEHHHPHNVQLRSTEKNPKC